MNKLELQVDTLEKNVRFMRGNELIDTHHRIDTLESLVVDQQSISTNTTNFISSLLDVESDISSLKYSMGLLIKEVRYNK